MAYNRRRKNFKRAYAPKPSKRIKKIIKNVMKKSTELKGVDIEFKPSGTSSTGVNVVNDVVTDMSDNAFVYPLNLVQPGTGSWNRIGNETTSVSLQFDGDVSLDWQEDTQNGIDGGAQPALTNARMFKCCIVHDKQPSGSLPKKSEMFSMKNQNGTEVGSAYVGINYDNKKRFTILKKFEMLINPIDNRNLVVSGAPTKYYYLTRQIVKRNFNFYFKTKIKTIWGADSNPATIADISSGAIYMVMMTDISTSSPTDDGRLNLRGVLRYRYTDN